MRGEYKKDYLIQIFQDNTDLISKAKSGDYILYEMPPFCSGEYKAIIFQDEHGLYIKGEDNYLEGCRDYKLISK